MDDYPNPLLGHSLGADRREATRATLRDSALSAAAPAPPVSAPSASGSPFSQPVILATDLDGTFVDGDDNARQALYRKLRERAPQDLLIFVTGRGLESILPLLSDPFVPRPDFIIADVGATVVGPDLQPVQPLQSQLAERWPGTHRVLEALAPFTTLQRQTVPQERRCSFTAGDPATLDPRLPAAVQALGCELLYSAGRYLDVLPQGVSKGSTLRALVAALGLEEHALVVAGDTLNDRSMYTIGAFGIVVGEAEPALIEAVAASPQTYVARAPAAGGILEGLAHHGLLAAEPDLPTQVAAAPAPGAEAQLVMLYHRLPFDEQRSGTKVVRRSPKSPNGIIPSLLGFFAGGRCGRWIAWSQQSSRAPDAFEAEQPVDSDRYPHLMASRVALTREDIELFYKRFSKEAFWPVIFSFPSKAVFVREHWEHFVTINRLFAERAAQQAQPGATVWIHDYNLWMVPGLLRGLRPDLRIAFFHHTAFPAADIFAIVPWRREIASSLLQCDYIGFHIPRYVENFVDMIAADAPLKVLDRTPCAPRFVTYGCALGVESMATAIEVSGRRLHLGAHPVGIDVARIDQLLRTTAVQETMASLRAEVGHRRCIFSVERLDYVKGPLEKIAAFESFLEAHPELQGEVVLFNVVTPPAPGMEVYRSMRDRLDQAVGRVNGRFGRLDWTPIRYFYQALPFADVVAYSAVADVAWITPLRDGLNLVAKEYVASNAKSDRPGVLVLSEFAGAAVELHGALLTNPFDAEDMQRKLHQALTMDEAERGERMRRLDAIVRSNDVAHWGQEFLDAVAK